MASKAPSPDPDQPRSVLIVDDSAVARAVMARAIDSGDRCVVAGAVSDANAALAFLARHRVDVILLDIEMPGVDGLTALPDLIAAGQGARVLIVSSSAADGGAATVQALALGAADTLVKPTVGAFAGRFADLLNERLNRLVAAEEVPLPPTPTTVVVPGDDFDVVAIGASTGGIHALSQLLRALPAEFRLPMLITQHLPESFMPYFAAQVAVLAGRPCEVAEDHSRIRPGRILVAPGRAHMRIVSMGDGAAIRLSTAPAASGCLPSVDPMLESLADVYGARGLAVVLSGMGRDGAIGAAALAAAGGSVVVQDRASSVIWGMPGAAVQSCPGAAILPPDRIGALMAGRRRPSC
ncbi:MAG: response regulator [Sphingomonas sp.]|uniref:chemotaxis protein CheB n=1 Tax=Sphingomonas sp. TaxID=28214 RepID=UPI001AC038CE|nr:chemotaxis protein CheB [Sphingomonas sp.]MBN8807659.1 response regulator [Sphingomonas sp.]